MRRLALMLAAASLCAPSLYGQSAQTPQAPVFRGGVTMVPVDVTVLDRNGKPVAGLTADDFEIKLDGKVQPVRTIEYEQAPPTAAPGEPASPAPAPTRTTTNATAAANPRVFVLLVDDLVISPARDKGLFLSASRFVADLPKGDLVGFTTSTGGVTVNPTRDRAAVEAGLRKVSGSFVDPRELLPAEIAVSLGEAEEIGAGIDAVLQAVVQRDCGAIALSRSASSCRDEVEHKARAMAGLVQDMTDRQLLSYLGVISAMRDLPGQKVLVVLTDGLIVTQHGKNQASGLQPIAQAATAAGVQFNVLFGAPDETGVMTKTPANGEATQADGQQMMQGIQTVADLTGGNFFRVMGQPDRFFGFVEDAVSGVYHLGVEAPSGSPTSRNFTLAARVKQQNLTVHASRVAVLAAPAAPVPVDTQLRNAVAKAEPRYGVPVTVGTAVRLGEAPGSIAIGANIEVPGTVVGPLTMEFGLVNSEGKMLTGRKTVAATTNGLDYRVALSLPVPAGQYQLRFAVADSDGHVGSINRPIDAQLAHVGPFTVSDLLTAWSGADHKPQFLALDELPAGASTLHTFLEIYGEPAGVPASDLRVEWTIVGESAQPVADQVAVPVAGPSRMTVQSSFPLATLPRGTYEIRATLLVAGKSVGSTSTTFRKIDGGGLVRRETLW